MVERKKALINHEALVVARKISCLDLESVAIALDVDVETVISWENGQNLPYFDQLLEIVDLYNKPAVFFYLQTKDLPYLLL